MRHIAKNNIGVLIIHTLYDFVLTAVNTIYSLQKYEITLLL